MVAQGQIQRQYSGGPGTVKATRRPGRRQGAAAHFLLDTAPSPPRYNSIRQQGRGGHDVLRGSAREKQEADL